MPVAVNCEVRPAATETELGVTAIDFKTAALTVTGTLAVTPPIATVTVVVPTLTPVTKPVLLTLAVVAAALVQVAPLKTAVLLSV